MNIVISGTVGVGKSTISNKLNEKLAESGQETFLFEELGEFNPYLENYYENRPAWSFLIQIDFVIDRFNKAFQNSKRNGYKIFDRHFLDDYVIASMPFVKDDMSDMLWNSYYNINKELNNKLKESATVDYLFLLKADFENVIHRVEGRGREEEKSVNIDYWNNMYEQYYHNPEIQEYFKSSVKNFIIIDANSNDIDEIVNEMLKKIS